MNTSSNKIRQVEELAGVLACSDKRYLPAQYRDADRQALRETFEALKQK